MRQSDDEKIRPVRATNENSGVPHAQFLRYVTRATMIALIAGLRRMLRIPTPFHGAKLSTNLVLWDPLVVLYVQKLTHCVCKWPHDTSLQGSIVHSRARGGASFRPKGVLLQASHPPFDCRTL